MFDEKLEITITQEKMQSKFARNLELSANGLIIIVAIVLGYFLIQKFFFQPQTAQQPTEIAKGTKVSMSEIDWNANQKTLLVFLQKSCPVCTESMPFYKNLVEKSKEKDTKIVAVLPSSREESLKYLKENGVDIQEIKQFQPDAIDVSRTPTLILVNAKGEVENSWIGKLPSEKEAEVMGIL